VPGDLANVEAKEKPILWSFWSKFSLCLHVAITPGTQETPQKEKEKEQLHSTTYKNKYLPEDKNN